MSSISKDTLRSLSEIKIEGEIQKGGILNGNYNGSVNISVYDKENTYKITFSDDNTSTSFKLQNNIIYEGIAAVKSGRFSISFTAPKDINYNFGLGKISMYSTDSSTHDATGSYNNIVIGGVNSNSNFVDVTPPEIKLYINDESFRNGGLTHPNPKLIIKLSDESGINISSSGVGHEITAVLNDSKETLVLNNFYNSLPGENNSGIIDYPFYNLPAGKYTIKVKAWDIYNNSSINSIDFVVSDTEEIEISSAGNYPNPFLGETMFAFDHNKAGDDLEVKLSIFSLSGIEVKNFNHFYPSSLSHVNILNWSGKDDSGTQLPEGLYLYKILVNDISNQTGTMIYKKLIMGK